MVTIISIGLAIISTGVAIWALLRNRNKDLKLDQEAYNKLTFQVETQEEKIMELKAELVEVKKQVSELDRETKKDMKEMEKSILGHINSLDTKFERFDEKIDKLKDILLENRK
jgi:hypothetical protein